MTMTMKANAPVTIEDMPAPSLVTKKDATKWLHKTKLCVYRVQGACRLGSKCSFAHSVGEVQDAPNLHKTQMCEAFLAGNCTRENCTFAHGDEELRLSPNFKNKLCKWFGKGKCRNGVECGFAHGQEQLRSQPEELEQIAPPPGLSLEDEAQRKTVLTLSGGLVDEKAPVTLETQVEGMSATISALQWKMDEMALRTQVNGMKQFLGQLTDQCAMLEQQLAQSGSTDLVANAPWKKKQTPLKTKLSSTAKPFQPTGMGIEAQPFVPNFGTYQPFVPAGAYEGCHDTYWPSDESTSIDSGGETGETGGSSD